MMERRSTARAQLGEGPLGDGSILGSRRIRASPPWGRGDSIKHCTWTRRWREAEKRERHGEGGGGGGTPSHSTPHGPVTTTPLGVPVIQGGNVYVVFLIEEHNITVCHSCSRAPGPRAAPANPRGGGRTCAPSLAPASSPNTFMQNTQRRSECSQEPSRLWSSAGSL